MSSWGGSAHVVNEFLHNQKEKNELDLCRWYIRRVNIKFKLPRPVY